MRPACGVVAIALLLMTSPGCEDRVRAAAWQEQPGAPENEGRWVQGLGRIEPAGEVRKLGFERPGVLERCLVTEGQRVEAGEPLMRLRGDAERAELRSAEAALLLARAQHAKVLAGIHPAQIRAAERVVERLSERVRFLGDELRRKQDLLERRIGTEVDRDRAATDLAQTQKDLDAARAELDVQREFVRDEDVAVSAAQLRIAEARVEKARVQLAQTELVAPIDGTVLDILVRPGEALSLEDPVPVLAFADLSTLRVRAEIDERFVPVLRVDQAALVFGRNLGETQLEGKVVDVARVMGRKRLESHRTDERRDRDVIEVLIDLHERPRLPIGLRVDVKVRVEAAR